MKAPDSARRQGAWPASSAPLTLDLLDDPYIHFLPSPRRSRRPGLDMERIVGILRGLGVNRPAFFALATRGAQSAVAVATIAFVGRFLTPETQGYYYTILSFVTLVLLGEFGVSYAVMQSASHEAATLLDDSSDADARAGATGRLRVLLGGAMRFNAWATVVGAAIVAAIGARTLATGDATGASSPGAWAAPWSLALVGVVATQLLAPRVALLEGAGEAAAVWTLRFRQELVAAAVLWGALAAGLALWGIGLAYATRFVYQLVWLATHDRSRLLRQLRRSDDAPVPAATYWKQEVWPFQWRVGLSALAGYLIFQLFTPIMFALHGPRVAGQFGMTLAITNGLLIATTAWLSSQAPLYGRLIARRDYALLNREFGRAIRSSFAVVLIASLVLLALVRTLEVIGHPVSERVLPTTPFALLVASTLLNHLIFGLAVYLRAHRQEPLLIVSVCGAVAAALTIYLTARFASITWVAASYLALTALGGLITVAIFIARTRSWHAAEYVTPSPDGA